MWHDLGNITGRILALLGEGIDSHILYIKLCMTISQSYSILQAAISTPPQNV